MRVHIGTDHAGYELKEKVVAHLRGAGHDVVDHGALSYEPLDDYPPFCIEAAEAVVAEPGSLGVVIGGSGNGEQMAAQTGGSLVKSSAPAPAPSELCAQGRDSSDQCGFMLSSSVLHALDV